MSVKRYGQCFNMMVELREGDYVRHSDYAALERRLVELQEVVKEYTRLIDQFDVEYFGMADPVTPGLKGQVIAARAAVDTIVKEL